MLFNKDKCNICKMLIMTPFEINQASFFYDNPNDKNKKSQVVTSLLVKTEDEDIKFKEVAFWSDEKIFNDIKPETVYEVDFKIFDKSDVRYQYPSSFMLEKIEKCENKTIQQQFLKEFIKEKKKEEERCEKALAEAALFDELIKKVSERRQNRSFSYKNTVFEIIIDCDDEDSCDEEKIINKIKKSKDKIINTALDAAFKELFEDAKDWTENPNLTKQEFIDNLLMEKISIIVRDNLDNLEVVFTSEEMFNDNNVVCYFEDGKCDDVSLEG